MFDYIIRKAMIVDGTGKPAYEGDVAVKDGRIAACGKVDGNAVREIDGSGLVLAPGFIDMHSHTDSNLFVDPRAESKITQGVTLEVCGNCGDSGAPVMDEPGRERLANWRKKHDIADDWVTMDDYLTALEKRPIGVNFITLVGHGNLREAAVGLEDRPATTEELARMRELAADAMRAGAFGISTGLIYAPGCFADTNELIEVSKGIAPYNGIYASHIRSERGHLVEAIEEAIAIGREAKVAVQTSHHKACGGSNWGKVKDSLAAIIQARKEGLDVNSDQYPYIATATSLNILLPKELLDGGREVMLESLKSKRQEWIEYLIDQSAKKKFGAKGSWDDILISGVRTDKNRDCEGLTVGEIAAKRGVNGAETAVDLLIEEEIAVSMVQFGMCEEDVETVMKSDIVMVGSDAGARSTSGPLSAGKPHPRAFGTFPRVLGYYVRERGVIPLETAIYKMTLLSARKLGLADRGAIKVGNWADLVLFDADKVKDMATFKDPHQNAVGIEYVFVNGRLSIENGELTGELAGRVIRKRQAASAAD
ncbi:MAG: N-acyl-D-amino-acid deacylase family protein [Armatimonadota bacterium]|jgi:N-acyl-D-amino-acid deacylase